MSGLRLFIPKLLAGRRVRHAAVRGCGSAWIQLVRMHMRWVWVAVLVGKRRVLQKDIHGRLATTQPIALTARWGLDLGPLLNLVRASPPKAWWSVKKSADPATILRLTLSPSCWVRQRPTRRRHQPRYSQPLPPRAEIGHNRPTFVPLAMLQIECAPNPWPRSSR